MAFSKVGDSQVLRIMSVEDGKTAVIKQAAVCSKCKNAACTCGVKVKMAEGNPNENRK